MGQSCCAIHLTLKIFVSAILIRTFLLAQLYKNKLSMKNTAIRTGPVKLRAKPYERLVEGKLLLSLSYKSRYNSLLKFVNAIHRLFQVRVNKLASDMMTLKFTNTRAHPE